MRERRKEQDACHRMPEAISAMQLKKWKLEPEDTMLLDLIPFLEALAAARTNLDVRDVITSYEGQDIPTAFKYDSLTHCNVSFVGLDDPSYWKLVGYPPDSQILAG